jgi:hypothetical protein
MIPHGEKDLDQATFGVIFKSTTTSYRKGKTCHQSQEPIPITSPESMTALVVVT